MWYSVNILIYNWHSDFSDSHVLTQKLRFDSTFPNSHDAILPSVAVAGSRDMEWRGNQEECRVTHLARIFLKLVDIFFGERKWQM